MPPGDGSSSSSGGTPDPNASGGSGGSSSGSQGTQPVSNAVKTTPQAPHVPAASIASMFLAEPKDDDLLDLNSNNWPKWSRHVKSSLAMCSGGLLGFIEGRVPRPDPLVWPNEYNNWMNNDAMVRAWCSHRARGEDQRIIDNASTAHAMWALLRGRHEKQGPYAQALLLRELLNVRVDASSPLPAQGRDIIERCERIIAMGPLSANSLAVVSLLHVLGFGFENIATGIVNEQARSGDTLTPTDIIRRLELEQQQINGRLVSSASPSIALSATGKPPTGRPLCTNCKQNGHWIQACYQIGGPLYPQRDRLIAEQQRKKAERKPGGTYAPSSGPSSSAAGKHRVFRDSAGKAYFLDGDFAIALSESAPPTPSFAPPEFAGVAFSGDTAMGGVQLATDAVLSDAPPPDWLLQLTHDAQPAAFAAITEEAFNASDAGPFVLDSGASVHLTPEKGDFHDFRPISPHGIRGVNGSLIYAEGVGSVRLRLSDDAVLRLDNVLYVPKAAVRLISVRALCDGPSNFSVEFTRDGVALRSSSGDIIFTSTRHGHSLFTLESPLPACALLASRLPNVETLHRRYGHPSYAVVWQLAKQLRAAGTPLDLSEPPFKCDSCILGKQKRSSVPKTREGTKAKGVGELIYIDGAGEQAVRSATGNLHTLDLIDDHSSMAWTFPVPNKSTMGSVFRRFVVAMRALGYPVKSVQIDNGELVSEDVDAVCAELGISVRRTAPYTSAHNGRVERLHHTLMSRSRTMRLAADIPENRWDELYVTACYLYNRSPTSTLPGGISPFQAFYGRPPDNSHLREIGCRAFVLINTHNPKIRARSLECVLIGYGPNSKTYRCYHRATHRVLSSYHVRFIESHEDPLHRAAPSTSSPAVQPPVDPLSPSALDDLPLPISLPVSLPPAPPPVSPDAPVLPRAAPVAAAPPVQLPPPLPDPPPPVLLVPTSPRRSTRLREVSNSLAGTDRLQRAIAESAASGERLRGERAARRNAGDALWSATDLAFATVLQLDSDYTGDPTSMSEAMSSAFADRWRTALLEEFASILEMDVYDLIPRSDVPANRKVMRGKPVFRLKRNESNDPVRFKARWVVRGYEAVFGLDYDKTTSPTMRMESFRILCHLAAAHGWHLGQLDVKTAYLYGLLPEGEVCLSNLRVSKSRGRRTGSGV